MCIIRNSNFCFGFRFVSAHTLWEFVEGDRVPRDPSSDGEGDVPGFGTKTRNTIPLHHVEDAQERSLAATRFDVKEETLK